MLRLTLLTLVIAAGCSQPAADPPATRPDMSDAGFTDTADAAECVPETDTELCSRLGFQCGEATVEDNCGDSRTVSCGTCPMGAACGTIEDNVCGCLQHTPQDFCERFGAECGPLAAPDVCGIERQVDCGVCAAPDECVGNVCGCDAETEADLCFENGAECGSLTVVDSCGDERTVDCGDCASGSCGETTPNQCGCSPESPGEFCARLAKNCGDVAALDNCGVMRTEDCGTCTAPATCGGGGTDNVCACPAESDQQFCARYNAQCGVLTRLDACDQMRTVDCGDCAGAEMCGGGGVANVCGCTSETDAEMCARLGFECEQVDALDNCGVPRTIDCGTCPNNESCELNQCECVPQEDHDFCFAQGVQCGGAAGLDNCGASRVVDCGQCGDDNQTCVQGFCECIPAPDSLFCDGVEAECGTLSLMDNCGEARTVDCGDCPGNGQCTDNQCAA